MHIHNYAHTIYLAHKEGPNACFLHDSFEIASKYDNPSLYFTVYGRKQTNRQTYTHFSNAVSHTFYMI